MVVASACKDGNVRHIDQSSGGKERCKKIKNSLIVLACLTVIVTNVYTLCEKISTPATPSSVVVPMAPHIEFVGGSRRLFVQPGSGRHLSTQAVAEFVADKSKTLHMKDEFDKGTTIFHAKQKWISTNVDMKAVVRLDDRHGGDMF